MLSHSFYSIWSPCTLLHLHLITQFKSVISSVKSGYMDWATTSLPACLTPPTTTDCSIFDTNEDAVTVHGLFLELHLLRAKLWSFITFSVSSLCHLARLVPWENVEIRVSDAWNMNVSELKHKFRKRISATEVTLAWWKYLSWTLLFTGWLELTLWVSGCQGKAVWRSVDSVSSGQR